MKKFKLFGFKFIFKKRYGKYFLDSIPTKNIVRIDQNEIIG